MESALVGACVRGDRTAYVVDIPTIWGLALAAHPRTFRGQQIKDCRDESKSRDIPCNE